MPFPATTPVATAGNREAWLTDLSRLVEPFFRGFHFPPYRITCGWPVVGGFSPRRRRIGESHGPRASKSGHYEVFISPLLDTPESVAGTVSHELCHVMAGIEAAHGRKFVKICKLIGLTKGSPTSARPGERLAESLRKLTDRLGPYPHSAIIGIPRKVRPPAMTGIVCTKCGCKAIMSFKWLEAAGFPACACGGMFTLKEEGED
jgi:hypothetical protein